MAKTKKATKVNMNRGKGKSKRAMAIELMKRRPQSVDELSKALKISDVHVRSILFVTEGLKAIKTPTRYSL